MSATSSIRGDILRAESGVFPELNLNARSPSVKDSNIRELVLAIIKGGQAVTSLILSNNTIGNDGLDHLILLASCLTKLILSYNAFGNEGVYALLCLEKLTYLDISENAGVTNDALILLLTMENLTTLRAYACGTTDSQNLEDAVKRNTTLLEIDFGGGDVSPKRLASIKGYIERNRRNRARLSSVDAIASSMAKGLGFSEGAGPTPTDKKESPKEEEKERPTEEGSPAKKI